MDSQGQVAQPPQEPKEKPEKKKRIKKEKKDNGLAVARKPNRFQIQNDVDKAALALRERIGELQIPDSLRLFFMRELKQTVPIVKEIIPEHKFLLFGEIPLDMDFFINKMKVKKLNSTRGGVLDKFRVVRRSIRHKNRIEFDLDGSQTALTDFQYIIEALRSINNQLAHDFASQLQNYQDVVRRILARNAYYRKQLQDNNIDMEGRLAESLKKAEEILETLNPTEEIFIYNIISKQFNGMVTIKKGFSRGLINNLGVSDDEFEAVVKENKLHSTMMEQVNHASVIYSQEKMEQNPYIRLRAHEVIKPIHPDIAQHHSHQFQNILKNLLKEALSKQKIVEDFLSREQGQADSCFVQNGDQSQAQNYPFSFEIHNQEFIPNPLPSFTQYQKFIKNINLHPLKYRFPLHKQIELFQNITQVLTKKQTQQAITLSDTNINLNSCLNLPCSNISPSQNGNNINASNNVNNQNNYSNKKNFDNSMIPSNDLNNPQMEIENQIGSGNIQNPPRNQVYQNYSETKIAQKQDQIIEEDKQPEVLTNIPLLQSRQSFDITEYRKKQDSKPSCDNGEEEIEKLGQFLYEETQSNPNDQAVSALFEEFHNFSLALKNQKTMDSSPQDTEENDSQVSIFQEEPSQHPLFYDEQSFQKNNSSLLHSSAISASSKERLEAILPTIIDSSKGEQPQKQNGVYFHSHQHYHESEHSQWLCNSLQCLALDNQHRNIIEHHHNIYDMDSSSSPPLDSQQNKIKDFYEQLLQYIGNDDAEDGLFPFPHINSTFKADIIKEYEQIRSLLDDNYYMNPEEFDKFIKQIFSEPRIKKKQYLKHLMKIPDYEDYSQKEKRKKQQKLQRKKQDINLSSFLQNPAENNPGFSQNSKVNQLANNIGNGGNNSNGTNFNFNNNNPQNQSPSFGNQVNQNYPRIDQSLNSYSQSQIQSSFLKNNRNIQASFDSCNIQQLSNLQDNSQQQQYQKQQSARQSFYSTQQQQQLFQQYQQISQNQQFQQQQQLQAQDNNSIQANSANSWVNQASKPINNNNKDNPSLEQQSMIAENASQISQEGYQFEQREKQIQTQVAQSNPNPQQQCTQLDLSNNISDDNSFSSSNSQRICHNHLHSHPIPDPRSLVQYVRDYFKADSYLDQASLLENIRMTLQEIIHRGFLNRRIGEFLSQKGNFNRATEAISNIITNKEIMGNTNKDINFSQAQSPNQKNFKKTKNHQRQDQVIKKVYELNTNISQDDEININEYLEVYYIGKTKVWKDFSKDFILNNSFRDIQQELSKLSQNEFLQKYYPQHLLAVQEEIKKQDVIDVSQNINPPNSEKNIANNDDEKGHESSVNQGIISEEKPDLKKVDMNQLQNIIKQFKMGPPHPFKILLGLKKSLQKILHHVPHYLISQPFIKNALKMIVFFSQGDAENYIKCRKRVPLEAIEAIEKHVMKKLCQIPII